MGSSVSQRRGIVNQVIPDSSLLQDWRVATPPYRTKNIKFRYSALNVAIKEMNKK